MTTQQVRVVSLALLLIVVIMLLTVASDALANVDELKKMLTAQVRELDDTNFEEVTQASTGMTTGPWFIVFKQDWCSHCKSLLKQGGEFEKFAELHSAHGVQPGVVDCGASPSTCKRFNVRAYPTLVMLRAGKMYPYANYARTGTSMTGFAREPPIEGLEMPKPLTWIDELQWWLDLIQDDFSRLSEQHPMVLYLLSGSIVFILICILVLAVSTPRAPPPRPPPRKLPGKKSAAGGAGGKAAGQPAAKKQQKGGDGKEEAEAEEKVEDKKNI